MRLTAAPAMAVAGGGGAARAVPAARRATDAYLVAVVALTAVVVPSGPAQVAAVDVLNAIALVVFALGLGRDDRVVRLPFLLPMVLIAAGSLLATTNATSLRAAALALGQDLYLYLWLVMLVHWLDTRGELLQLRAAWLWSANAVAAIGLGLVLFGASSGRPWTPEGARAASTFYNPNMFADYLVLSVFNALGLIGRQRAGVIAGSLVLLLAALLATKSNGGWISLGAGLAAWAALRAAAMGVPLARLAGTAALVAALVAALAWAHQEWGLGEPALRRLARDSFVGRIGHSSESRQAIWRVLEHEYTRSPLGIGPGNTAGRALPIGERERPDSFRAKEAHSDYLAYAAERGPLGFAGLALGVAQAFAIAFGAGRTLGRRTGGPREGRALQAALLAALVGTTVHSLVIEKLHFRHAWLFLAMLCALTGRSAVAEADPAPCAPRRFAPGRPAHRAFGNGRAGARGAGA